jgi:hypothetical protein
MKKYIVTTTINLPTEATLKFAEIALKKDWIFVIVGDTKTPHKEYHNLVSQYPTCVVYLTPDDQDKLYPTLSGIIGWKTIQRRNIGFVYAYDQGAEIVATVDDDNIPYDAWGDCVYVGQTIEVDLYEPVLDVFDPLSITQDNHVWHRGYPIQYLQKRHLVEYKGKTTREVLVQADLWDGDPDIDAMARLTLKPIVKYDDITQPYCSNTISPFNSQNTFLSRKVLPYYSVLPFVGRMDDIWGAYILQYYFPNSVIYSKASVYQDRNTQDLITNLENEIVGYRTTLDLVSNLARYKDFLPEKTNAFFAQYKLSFDKN